MTAPLAIWPYAYLATHANSGHVCYGRTYAEAFEEARLYWYSAVADEDAIEHDRACGILQITKQSKPQCQRS